MRPQGTPALKGGEGVRFLFLGRIYGYNIDKYNNNVIVIRRNPNARIPKEYVGIYNLLEISDDYAKLERILDLSNASINTKGKIVTVKNSIITKASSFNRLDTLLIEKTNRIYITEKKIVIKKGLTAIIENNITKKIIILRIANKNYNEKPVPLTQDRDWFEIV